MDILLIVCSGIIIILALIFITYLYLNNKYQDVILRIEEVVEVLEDTIKMKSDSINEIINLIHKKDNNIDGDIFKEMIKIRSRVMSTMDIDNKISNAHIELKKIKDDNEILHDDKDINKVLKSLKEYDAKLKTIHKYYDDNVRIYNDMLEHFPTNIIAKINKYQKKELFKSEEKTLDEQI